MRNHLWLSSQTRVTSGTGIRFPDRGTQPSRPSYEKRPLLSVVKNVKTPTTILTGEADYRTPMSDSEQYYQALKLLGVEAVLVRVPDEPHGIQIRPSHGSTILRILEWFDRHGKAAP